MTISDELIFPLLDESAAQKVPVYIPTGTLGNSTPWQITELAERHAGNFRAGRYGTQAAEVADGYHSGKGKG